jgi:uncharacterized protein YaiI (UPF0178 family)
LPVRIWVDADGCPRIIKDILSRAAERVKVNLTFVANRQLKTPPSRYIRSIHVSSGFDVADHRIVELVEQGDLVVTADIPLAADIIKKGGLALNPRGVLYTSENIGECLAMRDHADEMRSAGIDTGGPPAFSMSDRRAFASQLDRLLARRESV